MSNCFKIRRVVFDKKIFKVFHFVCNVATRILHGIKIYEQI